MRTSNIADSAAVWRSGDEPIDILFLHQNMPGQYRHLAPALARNPKNRVFFITKRTDVDLPGIRCVSYGEPKPASADTHHYLRLFESSIRHGQEAARRMIDLKREGFSPVIIIAHPGWGEALFAKDIWPNVPLLTYAEYYYHGTGGDIGFDPADAATLDTICRARVRNAHLLLSLEAADAAMSPTEWQRSRHPPALQPKITTIFDGINTQLVRPDPAASFDLRDGIRLTQKDEVITYVARNLEPHRGFPVFMRALPSILAARPGAHAVIVGGDEVSYGQPPSGGHRSWREAMLAEVDLAAFEHRVHFTGKLAYDRYLVLLRISSLHIYLTFPFVLSWSCIEAMAAGCLVLASDTAPVAEVIEDGRNGMLFPFFDQDALVRKAVDALAHTDELHSLRAAARETVLSRYDLQHCLRAQLDHVARTAGLAGRNG